MPDVTITVPRVRRKMIERGMETVEATFPDGARVQVRPATVPGTDRPCLRYVLFAGDLEVDSLYSLTTEAPLALKHAGAFYYVRFADAEDQRRYALAAGGSRD